MKYKEAREYRQTIEQRGMVLGLDNMKRLMAQIGNPQDKIRLIHVAGTNGKGSVVAYLSNILTRAGYRTGAYTSPAVFHPLEIYRINGERMTRERYAHLMDEVKDALEQLGREGIYPTPFEVDTAAAFAYFVEEKCDIAIVETGLGGALDATNCMENVECAVFTSISMDHVAVLGNTLEEIAAQKAGIVKEGCEVVSGGQETCVLDVMNQVCGQKHAHLTVTDGAQLHTEHIRMADGTGRYSFQYKHFPRVIPGIPGRCQEKNVPIVLEVVEKLCQKGYNIPVGCIIKGIEETKWHGRMTLVAADMPVILDGAHNVRAVEALAQELEDNWKGYRWIFVIGVLEDKDYEHMFDNITLLADKILTVTPPGSRALDKEKLAKVLERGNADVSVAENITRAVARAMKLCEGKTGYGVAVFGSFTILKEAEAACGSYMPLVERLTAHPLFREKIRQIEELERARVFCRHGWEHCMAVARAAALLNEEQQLGFPKQTLYALALVHDLGRAEQYMDGVPHEEAGVETARRILTESGFDDEQTEEMLDAIWHHREAGPDVDGLTGLLVRADKQTRLCFACEAREACKWPDEKKNLMIRI